MSKDRAIPHDFEGEELESVFVGRRDGEARPTVILIPTVMGVSDLEIGFGRQLVELGYNALVADLFGKKFRGAPRDTMFGEMNRLRGDRAALLRRLQSVLDLAHGLSKVVALGNELTEAGCDWQIHAYGHVGHGFTNPHASDLQIEGVAYNALAAERSWTSFINLLEELFG